MNLGIVGNVTKKIVGFCVKNSTTILTATAVAGVGATAVATGKAVVEARDIIKAHEMDDELMVECIEEDANGNVLDHQVYYRDRTKLEKVKLTWKCFVRPVFLGGTTIACIIGSNTISTRRNLALATAYSMSEEAAKEFRDKVAETIGEKKVEKIEHEIAQDHLEKNPVPDEEYITYTQYGEQLMYDQWTGRYFRSGQNEVDKKVNMLNKRMSRKKCSSTVNDFYELLGIPTVPAGEDWGWSYKQETDDGDVTVRYYPAMSSKGEPCIEVRINPELLHVYV